MNDVHKYKLVIKVTRQHAAQIDVLTFTARYLHVYGGLMKLYMYVCMHAYAH